MLIVPRFRADGARYLFLLCPVTGRLLQVIYPSGQDGLLKGERD